MPFYLNLWPDDVHTPLDPTSANRGTGSKRDLYRGVVQEMDAQLGPLFAAIGDNPQLKNNTLIIVASGNGPEAGAGSAEPFRGTKAMLYEGGIREPLIVWAPSLMPKGKIGAVNTTTVLAATDFAPSLLRIAGVAAPTDGTFDGLEMSAALLGQDAPIRNAPLFWKCPPDRPGPQNQWPDLAIRDSDWKLLMEEDGSKPQLYDLPNDIGEANNLTAQNPQVVQRLRQLLLNWNATLPAATRLKQATTPHESAKLVD